MKKSTSGQSGGFCVLILAAGAGTRMESSLPKVLHPVGGKPMVYYLLRLANALKPQRIGVVIGHEADRVRTEISALSGGWGPQRAPVFIHQKTPTGSGGAVLEAVSFLKQHKTALVLCGDTPLLSYETLHGLCNIHREQKNQVTLLTAKAPNPKGYGRLVRGPLGDVLRIVEESEATPKEAVINEVNSGAYCFEVPLLMEVLRELKPTGQKREQYLTHALELIRQKGGRLAAYLTPNYDEITGINSRIQLAQAEKILNRRALDRLMVSGVTVIDPSNTYADIDVEVERDTVLYPGTILRGKTKIGRECRIGPYSLLVDATVDRACEVKFSQVVESHLMEKSSVGPFSNLRPGSVIGPRAKIGNFTELKSARIGLGSKVPHLSYIGDAEIAEDVNIGAGTITCNYDGVNKHKTVIGAKAFIGSNVNLIAPVSVGRGAKIGAGSTITEDVPRGALAIARSRQINKNHSGVSPS